MGCRFFFASARTVINDQFPNLSQGSKDHKAKVAAKGTIDGYGWLNTLYDVAKENLFTIPGQRPLDSVLLTDLYEILTYLSWKSACNTYQDEYNKLHKK